MILLSEVIRRLQMIPLLFVTTVTAVIIDPSKIKEFKWRGPPVIDETVFTNPNSFDYDFNDDLVRTADVNDIYEENVGQLPNFNLYKLGQNKGVTKLPIVTRKMPTWSTVANTRGPLDFFATPSTPVSPVFVSTSRLSSTTSSPTTTTPPTTTTMRTTERITTTPFPTTTEAPTTTERTTQRQRFFQREKVVQQPPPVFKTGRGPIWRKGGRIEFDETTTMPAPTSTAPTTQFRNTFITFTRRPLGTVPGVFRNFGNRARFGNRGRFQTTTAVPRTTTSAPIILRALQRERTFTHPAPKPVVIHHGPTRYRGPTYNCRVMNPFEDGSASSEHNPSCKMLYPGMSADGTCRCYYKVSGRDEHGCATGFLYACKPIYLHSVVV